MQKYSWICNPTELDEVSDQVDRAIDKATTFVTVTSMYNNNKVYAPVSVISISL